MTNRGLGWGCVVLLCGVVVAVLALDGEVLAGFLIAAFFAGIVLVFATRENGGAVPRSSPPRSAPLSPRSRRPEVARPRSPLPRAALTSSSQPLVSQAWSPAPQELRRFEDTEERQEPRQTASHRSAPEGTVTFHVSSVRLGGGWQRRQVDPDSVWLPADRHVEVAGLSIDGGMLYVGRELPALDGWNVEPALIDPTLGVDRQHPDREGKDLHYWPSYQDLTPAARAAYLEWLADGRRHPDTPMGYVFLFYYGLERRLLVDAQRSKAARSESDRLLAEVERLLSIYGHDRSFRGYASSLLHFLRLRQDPQGAIHAEEPFPPPSENLFQRHDTLPLELRLRLGQLLAAGRPLSADWALAWYASSPLTFLRTAASRCPDLFRAAFEHHFRKKFGEGMKLRPNKSRLTIDYLPASSALRRHSSRELSVELDLPDVAKLEAPLRKVEPLVDAATDDLDAYSRWLGRNPGDADALPALALLPSYLSASLESPEVTELRNWVHQALGDQRHTVVRAEELLARWPTRKVGAMTRKEAAGLSQLLEKLDLAIEPDVRFGGSPLKGGSLAVLFPRPAGAPTSPSREYSAAAVLLHLAAVVAAADGKISAAEERHLADHLETSLRLDTAERVRLEAHLAWLLADPPGFAGLKKRLASLPEERRRSLAGFVISVAGADGRIDAAEVKILSRIYGLLGLEPESLYGDLHSLSATSGPATEPVTVRPASPSPSGFAIPPEPVEASTAEAPATILDMDRVARLRQESEETSRLLAEIFQEPDAQEPAPRRRDDEPAAIPQSAVPPEPEERVEGLDLAHSQLLRALAASPSWSRNDFEALAEFFGVLPDGALETLNEAAFERCDTPLTEGEDPIDVELGVLQEMLP